jgi:hypothetical protein
VLDPNSVASTVKSVWNGFAAALSGRDKASAMNRISRSVQFKYGPTLEVLSPYMPQIAATWSSPTLGALGGEVAELVISRVVEGKNRAFFIYVIREKDGVWRLTSM